MSIHFELPHQQTNSIIKVIGVGGGGGNAVNHMFRQGIVGVNFIVANTDRQALEMSPVPMKIQLGKNLTEGRGAGMNPDIGRRSALEALDEIKKYLQQNTRMLFITAGMGKGTGTGGAPVIAKLAREMNILTVALVTTPFSAEGPRRFQQAQEGIQELRNHVDTLIVVSNDKLREIHGNLTLSAAFAQVDNILANAAKSIAEIITVPGYVNVDFEDVNTVMKGSGVAIMGMATAEGEGRALQAVRAALTSPLLNDSDIRGAKNILVNISSGAQEVTLDEVSEITEFIQQEAGFESNLIWGNCRNDSLGDKLLVTVIATGFEVSGRHPMEVHRRNQIQLTLDQSLDDPIDKSVRRSPTKNRSPKGDKTLPLPLDTDSNERQIIETPRLTIEYQEQSDSTDAPVDPNDFQLTQVPLSEIVGQHSRRNQCPTPDTNQDATRDRIQKLRSLSLKLSNPSVVNELEREPAYKRRGIELNDPPHSSESGRSSYVLEKKGEDSRVELKKDNSFLHDHDRVD